MTNNAYFPARDCQSPNPHRLTVKAWKNAVGSYRILADQLGIKNTSYLSDFVNHGKIPGNRIIRDKMNIVTKKTLSVREFNASLKAHAIAKDWNNFHEYCRAINSGDAEIPYRD